MDTPITQSTTDAQTTPVLSPPPNTDAEKFESRVGSEGESHPSEMSEKPEKPSQRGMLGLANLGNTCYANAALQALRHQSDLTMYILQGKHKELLAKKEKHGRTLGHEAEFTKAYGELLDALWKQEGPAYVRPEGFWRTMLQSAERAGFEQFRMRAPHDSQEFLMFVLDMLHEGLKEDVSMNIRSSPRAPLVEESLQTWKRFFEKSYSPLTELLFTLQVNTVECQECKSTFHRWETNNMLKVSVPTERKEGNAPYEMMEILQKELEAETIEGYACDTCGDSKRTVAQRKHAIWRLGSFVIVVLKRNENSGRRINTPVNIPLTQCFESLFHGESTEASKKNEYSLFAIINHHGGSTGGHYNAQCKNPLTGQWNMFDDESVHAMNGPHLDESAYILMYR
jgi:ubiquitin C-terminal hydrolase